MSDHTNKLNYHCSVCNVSCTGAPNYQQHMRGKKHQDALRHAGHPSVAAPDPTGVQSILASLLLAQGTAAASNGERRRERDDPAFSSEVPAAKRHKPNSYAEQGARDQQGAASADVPGDYHCQICDCHCSSLHTWELHVKGRRHVRNALGLHSPEPAAEATAPRTVKHALAHLDAAILDFHKRKLVPEPGQALALASVVQHVMTALTSLAQQGARDQQGATDRLAARDISELKLIGRYAQGTMARDSLRAVLAVILRESLPPTHARVQCIAEHLQTHLTAAVTNGALVEVHVEVHQAELCIAVTARVKQDAALLGAVTGATTDASAHTTVHVQVPVTFLKAWSYSAEVAAEERCELAVCRAHLMQIRQHIWFETYLLNNNFFSFAVISPRVLLRILLHVRDQHPGLHGALSDWTLQVVVYNAVYCRAQPLHDVSSVAYALLTVWQYLAGGMLYPINRVMDPCTDPAQLLAAGLSRDQQRSLAQSALAVLDLLGPDTEDLAAWSQALHGTLDAETVQSAN